MRHPDLIDRLLADADPLVGAVPPAPDDASALSVRDRAEGRNRPVRRRALVAAAVLAGLLGATGATVAYSRGDGRAGTSDGVVCNGSEARDLQAGLDPRLDDPVEVCRAEWLDAFGVAAPEELTACVDPGIQGAIEVYPGPPTVCADHESLPFTGPTDEQVRFAAFRAEALALPDVSGPDECVTLEQIKDALDPLLTKHGLEGWTYGSPVDNEAPCAQVEGFVERTRTIVVSQHPRR